jgi:hypothetical protein
VLAQLPIRFVSWFQRRHWIHRATSFTQVWYLHWIRTFVKWSAGTWDSECPRSLWGSASSLRAPCSWKGQTARCQKTAL